MRALGLDAYRFSIAWPRILPEGRGRVNAAGLDFYDRFVDELLANGVEPFLTLYHWDLPQALEDRGGWTARETVDAFAEYAEVVAARLGDRVRHWITRQRAVGDRVARLRPGPARARAGERSRRRRRRASRPARPRPRRRGAAPRRARRRGRDHARPDPDAPADRRREADAAAAAHRGRDRNRWFLDPLLRGEYPADALERFAALLPAGATATCATIAQPLDFLGVNYYRRHVVRADPASGAPTIVTPEGSEFTGMGWEVYPDGAARAARPRSTTTTTSPPLYITENGAAFADRRSNGHVDDPRAHRLHRAAPRRARTARSTTACRSPATSSGRCSTTSSGTRATRSASGIVYVDFETLERVPKDELRLVPRLHRGPAQRPLAAVGRARYGQTDSDGRVSEKP